MNKELKFEVSAAGTVTGPALHRLFKKLENEATPFDAHIHRSKARGFWCVTIFTTIGHAEYFNNMLEKAVSND